jgi:hypothetical protein
MKQAFKKVTLSLTILFLAALHVKAQKSTVKAGQEIKIPMQPAYWEYDTADVEFITEGDVKAVRFKKGKPFILKNQQFSDGTIEYDVAFGRGFPGIYFRMTDDRKNGENFYLRYFGETSPESRTALQYSAVIDDLSIWDLTDEYQAGATFRIPGWNHVKLVVSGKQMKAYVNDMSRPAMVVPGLEGGTTSGGIFFMGGEVKVANLVIRPGAVEHVDPKQGYISTYNDPRYLRSWQVSPAIDFAYGKDVVPPLPGGVYKNSSLPDSTARWTKLMAEDRSIVNLTRLYGYDRSNGRRLAWLKTTIESDRVQERTLHLGFSDEIWLFVNGQILYSDKNHFGSPGQKFPRGRCTIENATIKLPLKQGKNEIMIGLAAYFYGWGIVARLDDTEGIHLPDQR